MVRNFLARLRRDEAGAGLVEYALLLALIAMVAFGAVSFFGQSSGAGYNKSTCSIAAATGDVAPGPCP
jgi:Flp pilus assembly pilin Flp